MRACADCRYAVPVVPDDATLDDPLVLTCRRYPPTTLVLGDDPVRLWTQIERDDWCGEWTATP